MAGQDASGSADLPLPQTDEGPVMGPGAPPDGGGPSAQGEMMDLHQELLDPDAGAGDSTPPATQQEGMARLLGVDQIRAQADARAEAAGVEDIAFDSDGVQHVINRLEGVREKLQEHRRHAWPIANIQQRPVNDPVSNGYADRANSGGEAYLAEVDGEIDALNSLIEKMRTVKEERVRVEEDAAAEIGRQG